MKKLVALLLAAMMVLGMASAMAEDVIELDLWTIAVESDASYQTFIDAIAAFEADHPGVKINHEPTQNEQYKIKISAAMTDGKELPDIFFTWGAGFLGDFVAADRVLCLDEYYDAYKNELPTNMCANATYGGKLYGVPYTMSEVVLYANMDLLGSVGYDHIPTTIEEMNECCDKLLDAGITPFGVSGKETWCLTEYLEPLMIKSVGTERLIKMYNGEESWNNPDVIAAVKAFQDMVAKNYFDPNASALGNDEVKTNFIAGKYAFYQNGSWNCGDIDKSGNAEKFQAGLFPVLNADNASLYELIGGPNNTLAVTASSEHKEEAVAAAFELGRYMSDKDYKSGANLPCWAPDPEAEVSALVSAVADIAAKAEGMVLFGDNILNGEPKGAYLDFVGLAYAGDITPEEFAQGMDDALLNK